MNKTISTDKAPAAVGPYSQAVKSGSFLFVSGQIPLDPGTSEIVEGGIKAQTKRVMDSLQAIIESAGMSLTDVVKCSCFLKDMNDFADFNEVYADYFRTDKPARECVEVGKLPKDVMVEVSAICGE